MFLGPAFHAVRTAAFAVLAFMLIKVAVFASALAIGLATDGSLAAVAPLPVVMAAFILAGLAAREVADGLRPFFR